MYQLSTLDSSPWTNTMHCCTPQPVRVHQPHSLLCNSNNIDHYWDDHIRTSKAKCFHICLSVHLRGEFRTAVSLLLSDHIWQDLSAAHNISVMAMCSTNFINGLWCRSTT